MQTEQEIRENLMDAGIDEKDAQSILSLVLKGDLKRAEKMIAENRKCILKEMHSCQRCIDRLDYLSYILRR